MSPSDNVVGNPLVVCTAHIHWDPEFCDVKLIQCMMLVQEIGNLLDEVCIFFFCTILCYLNSKCTVLTRTKLTIWLSRSIVQVAPGSNKSAFTLISDCVLS